MRSNKGELGLHLAMHQVRRTIRTWIGLNRQLDDALGEPEHSTPFRVGPQLPIVLMNSEFWK